ncbi:hypothetical protein P9112_008093 [Eukaryota sp. TZLM1-RC]
MLEMTDPTSMDRESGSCTGVSVQIDRNVLALLRSRTHEETMSVLEHVADAEVIANTSSTFASKAVEFRELLTEFMDVQAVGFLEPTPTNIITLVHASLAEIFPDAETLFSKESVPPLVFSSSSEVPSEPGFAVPISHLYFLCCFTSAAYIRPFLNSLISHAFLTTAEKFSMEEFAPRETYPSALVPKNPAECVKSLTNKVNRWTAANLNHHFNRYRDRLPKVQDSSIARSLVAQIQKDIMTFLPIISPRSKLFSTIESILVSCLGFTDFQAAHDSLRLLNCLYDGNALQLIEPLPVTPMTVGATFSLPVPPSKNALPETRFCILLSIPDGKGGTTVRLFPRSLYSHYCTVPLTYPGTYDYCYLSFGSDGELLRVPNNSSHSFRGRVVAFPDANVSVSAFATLKNSKDLANLQSALQSLKQKGASTLFVDGLIELNSNWQLENNCKSFAKAAESNDITIIPNISNHFEPRHGFVDSRLENHLVKTFPKNTDFEAFTSFSSTSPAVRGRSLSVSGTPLTPSLVIEQELGPIPLISPIPFLLKQRLLPNYRSIDTWDSLTEILGELCSDLDSVTLPKASEWPLLVKLTGPTPLTLSKFGGMILDPNPQILRNIWSLCTHNGQTWPNPIVLKMIRTVWSRNQSSLITIDTDDSAFSSAVIASGITPISSDISAKFVDLLHSQVSSFDLLTSLTTTSIQFVKISASIVGSTLSLSNQMSLVDLVTLTRNNYPCIDTLFADCLYRLRERLKERMSWRDTCFELSTGTMIPIKSMHSYDVHKRVASWIRLIEGQEHLDDVVCNCLIVAVSLNDSGEVYFYLDTKSIIEHLERIYDLPEGCLIEISPFNQSKTHSKSFEFWEIKEFCFCKTWHILQPGHSMLLNLKIVKENRARHCQAFSDSLSRLSKMIESNQDFDQNVIAHQLIEGLSSSSVHSSLINRIRYLLTYLPKEQFTKFTKVCHQLIVSKANQDIYWSSQSIKKLKKAVDDVTEQPIDKSDPYHMGAVKVAQGILMFNQPGLIVFVAAELGKWSTIGGLGVMVFELSRKFAKQGEKVVVISPYYHYNKYFETDYLKKDGIRYKNNFTFKLDTDVTFGVHYGVIDGVYYYFLHNQSLFNYPYEFENDIHKFKACCALSKGSLELLTQTHLFPSDLVPYLQRSICIVTNDWMPAPLAAFYRYDSVKLKFNAGTKIKIFHLVHNISAGYEGFMYISDGSLVSNLSNHLPFDAFVDPYGPSNKVSLSRAAFNFCHNFGTVSKTYLVDMKHDGMWTHALSRFKNPVGINNGVDVETRRAQITSKIGDLTHEEAKKKLQEKYFKHYDPSKMVLGFVGRFTAQKGVHLIVEAAWDLLANNVPVQFIVGGMASSGDPYGAYCASECFKLREAYPLGFWAEPSSFFGDGQLLNLGCDLGLMPSLFEPGGIVQQEFFLCGTPVVAFETGGLKDTVHEFNPRIEATREGNGFTFKGYQVGDLCYAIQRARDVFSNGEWYSKLRDNAAKSVISLEDVTLKWRAEFAALLGIVAEI